MPKSLGKPLYGTGVHFEWGDDQIIKRYGPDTPTEWIIALGRREKMLFDLGFPLPEVGELVEFEDGLGQVYERIEGKPLADELLGIKDGSARELVDLAYEFAGTHAKIHAFQDIQVEMPLQEELFPIVLHRIDVLPASLRADVLKALSELPKGNQVCHGDYHPFNVLRSPRGLVVIDWNNAHKGNPREDVARSKLMLAGFARMKPEVSEVIQQFNRSYLDRYFQLRPEGREQIESWWPVVAAIRLIDGISELQDWLLDQVRAGLSP